MAAQAGAQLGQDVIVGTALVVPAISNEEAGVVLPKIEGELAVFLVKDDPVVSFQKTKQMIKDAVGEKEVVWHDVENGGHAVTEEMLDGLVNFVKDAFSQHNVHVTEL